MNKTLVTLLFLTTCCAGLTAAAAANQGPAPSSRPRPVARTPLVFEPAPPAGGPAGYIARGPAYLLQVERSGATMRLRRLRGAGRAADGRVRLGFPGSSPAAVLAAENVLPGRTGYALGAGARSWRTSVPNYRQVRCSDLYPGIDALYYGREGSLEYDLVVRPGGDPGAIRLRLEAAGPEEGTARLLRDGSLALQIAGGEVRQAPPVAYQVVRGERRPVACAFRDTERPGEFSVRLGRYDLSRTLVIDPVMRYFTDDTALTSGMAVDRAGYLYVVGSSYSPNPQFRGDDLFVRKFNQDGSQLLYTFFVGGEEFERAGGIAVDADGAAYVTGNTQSTQLPVTPGAYQKRLNWTPEEEGATPSTADAFAAKINPEGTALVYATYLGGSWLENSTPWGGIAVDGEGFAYVCGNTESQDFPTTAGALRPSTGSPEWDLTGGDAFLVKLNGTGGAVYSTLFGGTGPDFAYGVGVDAAGSPVLAGITGSDDLQTEQAFQPVHAGNGDAFLARLTPDGRALVYSTYLGGTAYDYVRGVVVDGTGAACVVGDTTSPDFPVVRPIQGRIAGEVQEWGGYLEDLIVARVSPAGVPLYSTYLGGKGVDLGLAIAADAEGRVAVTGRTVSPDYPTFLAEQPRITMFDPVEGIPTIEAMVSKLQPDGQQLEFSTFVGADLADEGRGIVIGSFGEVFLSGNSIAGEFGYLRVRRDPTARTQARPTGDLQPFLTRLRAPGPAGPKLAVDQPELDFGSVRLGKKRRLSLRVANVGRSPLTVRMSAPRGVFQAPRLRGVRLAPGQVRMLWVRFTPRNARLYRGRIVATGSGGSGQVAVRLTGRGRRR